MNAKKIEKLIKQLLEEIGGGGRQELAQTPGRVAESFKLLFGGYEKKIQNEAAVFKNEDYDEMVICREIDFYSTCEHHLLPFFGAVHVGYIPKDFIIGISKIPKIVEIFSRRLQNQERLTMQIANGLNTLLSPQGVGVIIEAKHLCMLARGVEKQNSLITTSSFKGLFKKNAKTRNEFLRLISNRTTA